MEVELGAGLRWALIVIGGLIIFSIYIAALMAQAKSSDAVGAKRWLFFLKKKLAVVGALGKSRRSLGARVTPKISDENGSETALSERDSSPPRYLVILYVQAMEGYSFSGHAIAHAAKRAGLKKTGDERQGFFQYQPAGQSAVVHVTNRVKPGFFAWPDMDRFSTAGLSVFAELQSTGADSALTAMLDCAHKLADTLGGRLLDENHRALTTIKIKSIQEDVRSFFSSRHEKSGSD